MSRYRAVRGPHWGVTMDNMLIDFWRRHESLFNSSLESYHDKVLKNRLWAQLASSIGKPVSDIERRSRSLRTQYVRIISHPEKPTTTQQRILLRKLDFLRPYIVLRRSDIYQDDKFEEAGGADESIDMDMGHMFGCPLDVEETLPDPDEDVGSLASTSTSPPCPSSNPQVTELLPFPNLLDDSSSDPAEETSMAKSDILRQFAEVMVADMRRIKDPVTLMRLRRDVTDMVFKAVEEDTQRRYKQDLNTQTRQRLQKRRSKEMGRRGKEMRKFRRTSLSQHIGDHSHPVVIPVSEIKTELIEDETNTLNSVC